MEGFGFSGHVLCHLQGNRSCRMKKSGILFGFRISSWVGFTSTSYGSTRQETACPYSRMIPESEAMQQHIAIHIMLWLYENNVFMSCSPFLSMDCSIHQSAYYVNRFLNYFLFSVTNSDLSILFQADSHMIK